MITPACQTHAERIARLRQLKRVLLLPYLLVAAASALGAAAAPPDTGPARQAAVRHDAQHDFDFAFGSWRTHIRRLLHPLTGGSEWVEYDGTHTVRPLWGGRANIGELEADGPAGHFEAMSARLYNPETGRWHVSYGNPRDGSISHPVVGGFVDGRGEFYGETTVNGKTVRVRELYIPVDARTRRFEIAFSVDDGRSWETNWVMTDTLLQR
jgi:hypothetical protein